MKKLLLPMVCMMISACAYDAYKLKIDNDMGAAHGQSVYFRSSLRSGYAGQIRRVLSNKFGQMGLKTAASAESADYIAIFDIETFYKQNTPYKNTSYANTMNDTVLFSDNDDSASLYFSGNANMHVDRDQTCFTLNIGRKGTSKVSYVSTFCAGGVMETEEFLPLVLDLYGKYATYQNVNTGVQCVKYDNAEQVSCEPVFDKQQAFISSLWQESLIKD